MKTTSLLGSIAVGLAFVGVPALSDESHPLFSEGKVSYDQLCAKCHGKDLVNSGASSFDLSAFPLTEKERFYDSVANGKDAMPAWGDILRPGELDALWVYVATRAGTQPFPEDSSSLSPDTTAPLSKSVVARAGADVITEGALTACLARNGGALSGKRSKGGSGLDYRLLAELAAYLELDLEVVWFESEQDEESDPVRETYAQLSHRLCDVTASHPLYENAFGAPPAESAALPRWDDVPTHWRHGTHVPLDPIATSDPYMRGEIGLVFAPGIKPRPISGLQDLEGMTLGLQQGTLSGVLATLQAPRSVALTSRMFNPGPQFLWEVENGAVDVAIVDVTAFDFHRRQNPISELVLSDWRHEMGMNIGLAVLEENAGLLDALNGAIADMLNTDRVAELATVEGLHYARPVPPHVMSQLHLAELREAR